MKKPLSLVSLFFLLCFYFVSAQNTFQNTYGGTNLDWGTDVIQTFDGGFMLAGYTSSFGAGGYDCYLIKTDVNGDTLWTKTYGGIDGDRISSVKQTADSGYIFTGLTNSFGDGGSDVYVIKTDASGNLIWQRTFGGAGNDAGNEVIQTSDGGYIIVGYNTSLGTVDSLVEGVYVIKTDANGDSLWTKVYVGPSITRYDVGNSICQTHDGGYIIAGSGQELDSNNAHVYLLKIDSSGTVLWDEYIGGAGSEGGSTVQQTSDHGFIVTGSTNSFGDGSNDAYLIKTDSAGGITWSKTYGGASEDEGIYGQPTTDGGYFIIGETGSFGAGIKNYFFIKTDANGDTVWTKTYASPNEIDIGSAGKQTTDGGYILSGYRTVFDSEVLNFYVVKTDSAGNSGCNQTNVPTVETSPTSTFVTSVIRTLSGGSVSIPVSIIHSGCTVASLCLPTGVNESAYENNAISIYPNPTENELRIKNAELSIETIEIYNVLGNKVLKMENKGLKMEEALDVSSFPAGIYFVRVTGVNESWVGKFVKE